MSVARQNHADAPDYARVPGDNFAAQTSDEKGELTTMLMRFVAEDTLAEGTPDRWPLCHCQHIVKKGHVRDGTQLWKCRGCGGMLGDSTLRVLMQSKLGRETWLAYAGDKV